MQLPAHSSVFPAMSAQKPSQTVSQQALSTPQTQDSQVESSQPVSSRAKQQSLTHGQLAAQSSGLVAMSTQVASQILSQHAPSTPQTHAWQAESSHSGPAC